MRNNTRNKKGDFGKLNESYISPFEIGQLKEINSFYVKYVKRLIDIVIALIAVIITIPINIILAIITIFDVGFPIFFIHERPGLSEKPFKMVKFRNMNNDTDSSGRLLSPPERITKWGSFVRKTSLDELLQFWMVLFGKMSIIGPRPLLMEYLPRYSTEQHRRHSVKPGLECPIINGNGNINNWEDRLNNDLWYVDNISFVTDLMMFVGIIKLVFNTERMMVRSKTIDDTFKGK